MGGHATGMLLGDIASRAASLFGERPAFVMDGRVRSHAEVADRVTRTTSLLAGAGVRGGSRVAVLARNCPEVIETVLAVARLGAVVVPLNVRLHARELRFQIEDAGVEHAVVHPAQEALAREAGLLERAHWWVGEELDRALAAAPSVHPERPGDDAPVMALYTSGTTGSPKGCLLSQRGWIASNANLAHAFAITAFDRWIAVYPFFHVAGFGLATTHLMAGGSIVVPSSTDPAELWGLVGEHDVSVAAFPALLPTMLAHPDAARSAGGLRLVYGGAAMENLDTLHTLAELAPQARWTGIYGSTEAGNVASATTLADEQERPGTVGRPLLGVDAAILSEADEPLGADEPGELGLRGPATMLGYAGLPAETAAATRGGWLHTGDLMRRDADGYLYFLDRVKDMIKSGHENVFSIEVETVLFGHPDVADVAVVGVPDPRWGETVKAIVVLRDGATPDPDALDAHCRAGLAAYKRPRLYEFPATIARSPTSKVVKRDLRAAHDPARCVRPTVR